jgi:hypothetical protein
MRFLLAIASLPAALLALSAVATADAPPPPPKPQPKDFCIEVYQPVCGTKDGQRKTYSNRCFATVDGASDIGDGACKPDK